MPALSVTISDRRQRTSANTLRRYDTLYLLFMELYPEFSLDRRTISKKVILTRGATH